MMKHSGLWIAGVILLLNGAAVTADQAKSGSGATATEQAKSHAIESISYDEATRVLTLSFKRGTYRYEDVPADVYEELNKSDSKGSYFKENIRGKYKTTKVSGD